MINISNDTLNKHSEALKNLGKDGNKALARALNRAVDAGVTQAARSVSSEYYVQNQKVKKTIKTKKANANSLTAGFISAGNAIPLINFKTNPKRVPAKKPKILLQAGVLRSGGLGSIKNAFVNKTKSGKIHVLQRTTNSSYPIKVLYGLSIPQMVGSKKIGEKIEDRAVEILDSRVQHEIDRLLGVKW